MFFLSTVDHQGRPTASYKGGDPGFVAIVDERTIAFPSYDGNGMFFSMGNIAGHANIGMLFIDFENPHRMRVQGRATVAADDPLLARYKEAELVVRVAIQQTWVNCPRYIHRYRKLDPSRYVPRADCETPLAEWKRLQEVQDVLPPKDDGRAAAAGGLITLDEYAEKVMKGEG
jgi:predicted pyridoxine 5'-phosphate oxidase superfamily flavin-nucleotide-binding protein